jgi:uncharacterized membrane protein YqaE (UPF0057 family)
MAHISFLPKLVMLNQLGLWTNEFIVQLCLSSGYLPYLTFQAVICYNKELTAGE